jgi:hypothetical protein
MHAVQCPLPGLYQRWVTFLPRSWPFSSPNSLWGILERMTTSAGPRRHLASSPFQPDIEPEIEQYAIDDLVSHDSYGMGRVIQVETAAVTVDFRTRTVRITSPFSKMTRV